MILQFRWFQCFDRMLAWMFLGGRGLDRFLESRPSYGGYSGAPPNEKISWDKLDVSTPKFVIESDATIVLPLLLSLLE